MIVYGDEFKLELTRDRSDSQVSNEDDSIKSIKHDDFSVGRHQPSMTVGARERKGGSSIRDLSKGRSMRDLSSRGRGRNQMRGASGTRIDLIRRSQMENSSEGEIQNDASCYSKPLKSKISPIKNNL